MHLYAYNLNLQQFGGGQILQENPSKSHQFLVEDLPYEKLLGLSVLGASVTLQRLEIQDGTDGDCCGGDCWGEFRV